MFEFMNLKTGEVKSAFSYREQNELIYIKFTENGKEYSYSKKFTKILDNNNKNELPFIIYSFKRECYKCKQSTDIITYITFADGTNEDLKYPWNKERLLKNQDILAHLEDPSIEYYGLNVIGDNENYDKLLMNKYPDKIKLEYSKTQNSKYPMNVIIVVQNKDGILSTEKLMN